MQKSIAGLGTAIIVVTTSSPIVPTTCQGLTKAINQHSLQDLALTHWFGLLLMDMLFIESCSSPWQNNCCFSFTLDWTQLCLKAAFTYIHMLIMNKGQSTSEWDFLPSWSEHPLRERVKVLFAKRCDPLSCRACLSRRKSHLHQLL